jgi:hypothetical protein
MKRRLEIARGFIHHPKILFLDEPTLGLDPQTRHSMWMYLREMNQTESTTIFFTTHYMEEADRVAQCIAIIDHGKLIATGTSEELKKQTNTTTLEDAFLALTGKTIREEPASSAEQKSLGMAHGGIYEKIYVLWLRQIKYMRSDHALSGAFEPLVFLLILGYGRLQSFSRKPGLLRFPGTRHMGQIILFNAMFSGTEVIWDRQFGFLKETLVAPISRFNIMIGRTLGGATVATIHGTLVMLLAFLFGFQPANWFSVIPAIGVMFLVALLFTSLGTLIASLLRISRDFSRS